MSGNILDTIFDKKGQFDFLSFSGYVEKRFQPVTFNRTLYVYDPETSLYAEDAGGIEAWTQEILEDAVCISLMSCKTPFAPMKKEALSRATHHHVIQGKTSPFNQFAGVPVGNGVLIFDGSGKVTLTPYKADMLFTHKLRVNYRPDADPGPIDDILRQWVDPEDVNLLYQMAAQSLVQSLPDHEPNKKAYLIQGETNGGKSTFLNLLEALFGAENISGVSLDELPERFNKSSIAGKFLNVADDIQSVSIKNVENFKAITGRRSHEIEEKFKPRYVDDIHAVFCYTCNRPPIIEGVAETDDAFWSRWFLIRFPRTFPVVPGWYAENFTEPNLEGFFCRVVSTAAAMLQNGGKLLVSCDMADTKFRWQHEASPLIEFLEEQTDRGTSFTVGKDEFFEAFWRWVDAVEEPEADKLDRRRRSPSTKTSMSQALIRQGIEPGQIGRKNKAGIYKGIRLKLNCPYLSKKETENGVLV